MKHLAEHFFFSGDLDIAVALCTRAIKNCDHYKSTLLKSDLNFILGKIHHKQEKYQEALDFYFKSVKLNQKNYAAYFCLAKIHYLNGHFPAAEESLNKFMTIPKFRYCYEALRLLAKVKQQTGDKYEAMIHFKRCIELNPQDYKASFEIAQMFDQVDQPLALHFYEQGLKSMSLEIEKRHKLSAENLSEEEFYKNPNNLVPPEILNNIGVLRLEQSQSLKFINESESKKKSEESLKAFKNALYNIELLQKIHGESSKLQSLKISTIFNMAYWYESDHKYDQAS